MIRSPQNPLIKETLRLRKSSSSRRKSGRFLIDGEKEIAAALSSGFSLDVILYSSGCESLRQLISDSVRCVETSPEVQSKISYGQRSESPVAIGTTPEFKLSNLSLNDKSLLLVLDRTEKPGNLGACLRTAMACNVDAVILSDPICEVLNPNVIRASRGAVFHIPIGIADSLAVQEHLRAHKIDCCCARVDGSQSLWDIDFATAGAFVFGNEATGLQENWTDYSSFVIPTADAIDSLNLSISTAITFYEAMRQRQATTKTGNT